MADQTTQEATTVEMSNSERNKYKVYFGISLIVLILFLLFADEWFWLALPFLLTYFVIGWNFI